MIIPTITVIHVGPRPGHGPLEWAVLWREPRAGASAKRRSKYFATEAEAEKFKADLIAALKAAPQTPPPAPTKRATVAGYLTSWLAIHVKPKREAATYRSYEQLARVHIVPAPMPDGGTFGDLALADLRPLRVAALYEDLFTRGVSLATRRHVHACLSSACSRAVLDELLPTNPCLGQGRDLRHKGEESIDPEPNPFTREEAAAFLAYVTAHESSWVEYFQFLHDTGVRVGEAAALKWSRVDLQSKRAEIVASYSPSDKADKAPKTHQCRWIDLSDVVVAHLQDWKKRQRVEALKRGLKPREYVFTLKNGSPRRQDGNMRRVFDRAMAACKLNPPTAEELKALRQKGEPLPAPRPKHSPHDLRDTFATTHLSADYRRLPWVSRQLGHETERTTVEHYFRFLPTEYTKQFANQIR